MKISTNTLTYITNKYGSVSNLIPDSIDVLAEKIGAQLGAIEEIEKIGAKYDGVVVAKVMSCVDHPNADRLHICAIDDGCITPDVKRNDNGHVQVVCGAPNVRTGMLVAWLPPGSTVPDSIGKDPFVLGSRELRGVMSNGMLASPKELAIGDSHEGILEVDADVMPGTSFADAYDIKNDHVIDIENKMFTHRPDCFGWMGVAREIAGIQGKPFVSPSWYTTGMPTVYDVKSSEKLPLVVQNDLPELVPRFIAATLSNIEIKPSPVWLQLRLVTHGIRPINNVVDITNFIMLETGQPMHAYDYDKVRGLDANTQSATIGVRKPKNKETLELLSGKTITPHENAILITTATTAIGLGGVMGGADTEVSADTSNIILECASFDMYSIRRTAMSNGIFTDAVTRFTKGQSPLQNKQVAEKAISMLEQYASAKFVEMYDNDHTNKAPQVVRVATKFVNDRLGLQLTTAEMKTLLENVEFIVGEFEGDLTITVPFWRTDIAIPEDIVEEVGRLYGYDKLPLILPKRSISPAERDAALETKAKVRDILARAGANEVLTYSFVHGNILSKVGQNSEDAFSISNALSPDLQYYRLSITPSLLEKIHPNVKSGYGEFAIFETGTAHAVTLMDKEGLPKEWTNIALVYVADEKKAKSKNGAAFYEARQFAEQLLQSLGIEYSIEPADTEMTEVNQFVVAPFDAQRKASVKVGNEVIGYIGEYAAGVRKNLKLPEYTAGFELSFDSLIAARVTKKRYQPLSRYPSVEQDMTFRVQYDTTFQALWDALKTQLQDVLPENVVFQLSPRDIYAPKGAESKNITFRINVVSYEKTLTDQEVNGHIDEIAKGVKNITGGERV